MDGPASAPSLAIALLAVGASCGPEYAPGAPPGEDPIALLAPDALLPVEPARDPFLDHRPPRVECGPGAWGPEGGGFEIQTGVCAYAAFDQPLGMPLAAGEVLRLVIWHDLLDAAEPSTGHVALWVGDGVLWEAHVGIPAPSAVIEARVVVPWSLPASARMGIHLHNHGYNSWRIVSVDRE